MYSTLYIWWKTASNAVTCFLLSHRQTETRQTWRTLTLDYSIIHVLCDIQLYMYTKAEFRGNLLINQATLRSLLYFQPAFSACILFIHILNYYFGLVYTHWALNCDWLRLQTGQRINNTHWLSLWLKVGENNMQYSLKKEWPIGSTPYFRYFGILLQFSHDVWWTRLFKSTRLQ